MAGQLVRTADTLKTFLSSEKARTAIAEALPSHMTPERVIMVAAAEVAKTPALASCTLSSVYLSIVRLAQVGLEPGGPLGHAYMVPYGQTATPIIGYRGMIDLARRSGHVSTIEAHCVHEGDHFRHQLGDNPLIEHVPTMTDRGDIIAAYAIARLRDGTTQREVMTRDEIDAIRARSKAGRNGPWVTDFSEMARKTVVRRLFKYLPTSVELANAVAIDDEQYQEARFVDVDRPSSITERFTQPAQPVEIEPELPEDTGELYEWGDQELLDYRERVGVVLGLEEVDDGALVKLVDEWAQANGLRHGVTLDEIENVTAHQKTMLDEALRVAESVERR